MRTPAPRHLLGKLLQLDPDQRCTLEAAANHAYLSGGLDTVELSDTFQGLQRQQESMQHEMARIEAELIRRDKLRAEGEDRMQRYTEQRVRRAATENEKRRSIFNAAK